MIDINNPRGGNSQLDELIRQYQLQQQGQVVNQQPSAIAELDEFLSSLTADKKAAVETSPEYQSTKLRLFEKFFVYMITKSNDGSNFLMTNSGKRLSQELLDVSQNLSRNFESSTKSEFQEMRETIQKQSEELKELRQKLESSVGFDFSKPSDQSKNKKDNNSKVGG